LQLHRIDPDLSHTIAAACARSAVVAQTVEATLGLYGRKGFKLPWVGYLAEEGGQIVGGCGFAGPPDHGEAEIAYFTFPGNEGRGVATRMAAQLIAETRQVTRENVLIAHTLPCEGASTCILRRLGFQCIGTIEHPEDGAVWKWREAELSGSGCEGEA
jgi:RimJ/RimL family protein N-acetyltransferase